ncbi:MAG: bifunctional homocysteine S-methyltransferase/methylenetetrahydrofolate reductase [Candidatus Competibacteraceae bacterium]|nr:MAG: bifunctional homocysteine S-methyltransferase/methylenetetrahydrofolate reductase [Candidatus Competibacteraceae bacterium]
MKARFLSSLHERPLVFDGGMGTLLYTQGVFVNVCYDELCRTQPDLVLKLHQAYVVAGVDVIETNSFGANRYKLQPYGLAADVAPINRAAAELARRAVGPEGLVAGSVGPLFTPGEVTESEPIPTADVAAAFGEQIEALVDGGVDVILLETFTDIDHLIQAAAAARRSGCPVIASFTLRGRAQSASGPDAPEVVYTRKLNDCPDVDVIGLNCGVGPAGMLERLRNVMPVAQKPVLVMPNAGGPSEVGGRMLYFNSPEYFTEYAKRYIELGARAIGGCCGTTPDDMRCAARALSGLSGVRRHLEIHVAGDRQDAPPLPDPVPLAQKSAFGAALAAGRRVTSVELLPPRQVDRLEGFIEAGRQCREAGVDAINIPDGPRACARLSVLVAAMTLEREAGIEAIPHLCCRDRNLIALQSDLLGAVSLGLRNWLLITGDPPKLGDYPDATGVFDIDAIGLCRLVNNLNRGCDAVGKAIGPPAGLVLGVGANPVAIDIDREVDRFAAKIDAGAEFAITQPVFDPDALLRFLDRVNRFPRTIPILAGLYPLISLRNAEFMNAHVPGVDVPQAILKRMAVCRDRAEGIAAGIEIARDMQTRIADAVAGIQVSAPLGKLEIALAVLA